MIWMKNDENEFDDWQQWLHACTHTKEEEEKYIDFSLISFFFHIFSYQSKCMTGGRSWEHGDVNVCSLSLYSLAWKYKHKEKENRRNFIYRSAAKGKKTRETAVSYSMFIQDLGDERWVRMVALGTINFVLWVIQQKIIIITTTNDILFQNGRVSFVSC